MSYVKDLILSWEKCPEQHLQNHTVTLPCVCEHNEEELSENCTASSRGACEGPCVSYLSYSTTPNFQSHHLTDLNPPSHTGCCRCLQSHKWPTLNSTGRLLRSSGERLRNWDVFVSVTRRVPCHVASTSVLIQPSCTFLHKLHTRIFPFTVWD